MSPWTPAGRCTEGDAGRADVGRADLRDVLRRADLRGAVVEGDGAAGVLGAAGGRHRGGKGDVLARVLRRGGLAVTLVVVRDAGGEGQVAEAPVARAVVVGNDVARRAGGAGVFVAESARRIEGGHQANAEMRIVVGRGDAAEVNVDGRIHRAQAGVVVVVRGGDEGPRGARALIIHPAACRCCTEPADRGCPGWSNTNRTRRRCWNSRRCWCRVRCPASIAAPRRRSGRWPSRCGRVPRMRQVFSLKFGSAVPAVASTSSLAVLPPL